MPALPSNPSLRHLKNEARQLHRALEQGDFDAVHRVKAHLRRLGDASEADILSAEVTLQETQHVIARDYGFENWAELRGAVGPGFDALADLPDHDLKRLLTEIDHAVLVTALRDYVINGGSPSVRLRILACMSNGDRQAYYERQREAEAEPGDPTEARSRIVEQARRNAEFASPS
ncbi:MAG: hypothetical protein CME04_17045 [Gemmatimonadaceae bacterium]|nr:hypothetical protein [Gemmatimonadaceae bacterium]